MTRTYLVFVSLSTCFGAVMADATHQCADFAKSPVENVYVGPHAKPDFASSPDASRFKTRILRDYTGKPDFAGHYQVVSWGCGSNCHVFVLIDTKTGKITFAPSSASLGAEYRHDSALFIIDPATLMDGDDAAPYRSAYFVWDGTLGGFRPLKECDRGAQTLAPGRALKATRP